MKTPAKHARQQLALEVVKLSSAGMSISAACRQLGIARSSFYEIHKQCPELFGDLHEQIESTNREQIALILSQRTAAVEKLILECLSEKTSPGDRLRIYIQLEKQLESLAESLRLSGGNNSLAIEILSGPALVQGVSRFAAQIG